MQIRPEKEERIKSRKRPKYPKVIKIRLENGEKHGIGKN